MNKFTKVFATGMVVAGLLAGCSGGDQASTKEDTKQEAPKKADQKPLKQPSEPKKDESGNTILTEVGQKHKGDGATAELLKIKTVNQTVDVAPLRITVKDIKIIKLTDLSEEFVTDIANYTQTEAGALKNGFSYIQVQYSAEKTTDGNVEWYDLMNVVTDKGEQIDGQIKDFIYDDAESDSKFIGKVKKDYTDSFILKDGEIGKVKLVFGNTINADTYDDITGQQTVEYPLQ